MPEILKAVTEIAGVSPDNIFGTSLEQRISKARSLCAFVAARQAGISSKSITEFLGKDPSSISNITRRIEERIVRDQTLIDHYDKIIKVLEV